MNSIMATIAALSEKIGVGLKANALDSYFNALPNEMKGMVNLLMQISEVDSWRYLLRPHLAMIYVVVSLLEESGVGLEQLQRLIKTMMDTFNFLANEFARGCHGKGRKWPIPPRPNSKNPRYAFLLTGHNCQCQHVHPINELHLLPQTFRAIAVETVRGLIAIEAKLPVGLPREMSLLYRCSWSARLLVQQAPNLAFQNLSQILTDGISARDAFGKRHRIIDRSRGYDKSFENEKRNELRDAYISRHMAHLDILLNQRARLSRPPIARRPRSFRVWQRYNEETESLHNYPLDITSLKIVQAPTTKRDLRVLIDTGLAPAEDKDDFFIAPLSQSGKSDYLFRLIKNALIYARDEGAAWGRNTPGFGELAKAYQKWFSEPWHKMKPCHRLSVFEAMLHLHVGILPATLAGVKADHSRQASELLEKEGIYWDLDLQALVMIMPIELHPSLLFKKGRGQRLPAGSVVCPLPPVLHNMAISVMQDYPCKPGSSWLSKRIRRSVILDKHLSATKLARAFDAYYCHWYGLEPEIGSLVAGRPLCNRVANAHYFQTSYERLAREYHSIFDRFHQEIIAISRNKMLQEYLPNTEPKCINLPIGQVGSLFVPNIKEVSSWLHKLRVKVDQLRTANPVRIIPWRNAICLYTYEVLRICTGMRTISVPRFTAISFNGNRGWLRLAEKGSVLGEEWRVVPLHSLVINLVKILVRANERVMNSNHPEHPDKDLLNSIEYLFFVIDQNRAKPLSISMMKAEIKKLGLEYPSIAANSYRHLLRTWLHQQGVSYKVADLALGHHYRSPHALDRLALLPIKQMEEEFLHAVDALVQELGLTLVEDWPC